MKRKELPIFRGEPRKILDQACAKHGVTVALLRELVDVQREYVGSGRQMGISEDFDARISGYLEDNGG